MVSSRPPSPAKWIGNNSLSISLQALTCSSGAIPKVPLVPLARTLPGWIRSPILPIHHPLSSSTTLTSGSTQTLSPSTPEPCPAKSSSSKPPPISWPGHLFRLTLLPGAPAYCRQTRPSSLSPNRHPGSSGIVSPAPDSFKALCHRPQSSPLAPLASNRILLVSPS